MKKVSDIIIVFGGVAGAIPPLVGASAAAGHVGLGCWEFFTSKQ